ncbi:MAG: type 4a pilus biogenesis protein PilO [Candidatus Omnitrophica bacterium]|nr:type 4a pilus biogenesis protein PilO [Candidatus Omnitrophota bacterium]
MSPSKARGLLKSHLSSMGEQIPRSQKLLLLTIGMIVATGTAGLVFIHAPWVERRLLLLEQEKQAEERLTLASTLHRQTAELERLKKAVLLQGGTPNLISEVSRLASKAGLQIESVAPRTELNLGSFTRFQIEVEATSNLLNLLNFLGTLEQHEPLLKVDRLEIGEIPAGESSRSEGEMLLVPSGEYQKATLVISAFSKQGGSL